MSSFLHLIFFFFFERLWGPLISELGPTGNEMIRPNIERPAHNQAHKPQLPELSAQAPDSGSAGAASPMAETTGAPDAATSSSVSLSHPLPDAAEVQRSSSTPLSPAEARLWRPAAQRNLRNQWSRLASCRQQWASSSSSGRSHATCLVNAYLSQRYWRVAFSIEVLLLFQYVVSMVFWSDNESGICRQWSWVSWRTWMISGKMLVKSCLSSRWFHVTPLHATEFWSAIVVKSETFPSLLITFQRKWSAFC